MSDKRVAKVIVEKCGEKCPVFFMNASGETFCGSFYGQTIEHAYRKGFPDWCPLPKAKEE